MKANERPINYERPQDDYSVFEEQIKKYFYATIETFHVKQLYQVNVDGLWETYLNNLPEDGRFAYDCRACKQFIERYGNLICIDPVNGNVESVLWGDIDIPPYFQKAVVALNNKIKKSSKISNVFISDVRTLGTPQTGVWTHIHVNLPHEMVNHSRTKNASQLMAEKTEDFTMLLNALNEYPIEIVEQAVALLQTNSMYRSNTILGIANWFLEVHKSIQGNMKAINMGNLIWKAVGEAPNGFCHIKSSMIGTLLDDIKAGHSTGVIAARFEEKMNPQNYMRSQSAPTASAIEQAEKLVEKLGIADSLRRRYARFDEIADKCLWKPKGPLYKFLEKESKGVFSNVPPKEKLNTTGSMIDIPTATMTWAKFERTVLPTAEKIEVKVDNPNRFMALITEAVPGSENIFKWNNPFSWYYHGGIDGEIKRRVEAAGGRYENCEIRCSLIWNNYTDLDIHCITPKFRRIYYGHKNVGNGWLDVDANGGRPTTTSPVENIRWVSGAPDGHYAFLVHNYCDRNHRYNPYKVELEVGGKIYSYNGVMGDTADGLTVFEFDYYNKQIVNLKMPSNTTCSGIDMWGLTTLEFAEVKGIVKSPNMWDKTDTGTESNNHTFFILKGCKDESEGKGRGFFNEILKPELREIRKTLEVYTASTPIEESELSNACGVGYSTDSEWDLMLRVTSNRSSRLIKIDRFD